MRNAELTNFTGTELISRQEAKDYLKVDFTEDDNYIDQLIEIARIQVLRDTAQVVVKQSFVEKFRFWGRIDNSIPVRSNFLTLKYFGQIVTTSADKIAVQYYNGSNVLTTLTEDTDYRVVENMGLIKIEFINTFNLYDRLDAIKVKYTLVPETDNIKPLRIAMLMLIQHYYDNRSPVSFLRVNELPLGYKSIITQYKNYIW